MKAAELKAILEADLIEQEKLEKAIVSKVKKIKGLSALENKRVGEANDLQKKSPGEKYEEAEATIFCE